MRAQTSLREATPAEDHTCPEPPSISETPDKIYRWTAKILMSDGTWRELVYSRLCCFKDVVAFTTDDDVVVLRKSDMQGLTMDLCEPEESRLSLP